MILSGLEKLPWAHLPDVRLSLLEDVWRKVRRCGKWPVSFWRFLPTRGLLCEPILHGLSAYAQKHRQHADCGGWWPG